MALAHLFTRDADAGRPDPPSVLACCTRYETCLLGRIARVVTVRLERYEVREGLVPAVCMKCGADATVRKKKAFAWSPPWISVLILVGLVPYVVVSVILTKRLTVHVPLCDDHTNHWSWRAWFTYLGLGALGVAGVAALVVGIDNRPGNSVGGLLCFGTVLVGIPWLITAAVLQQTAIRPTEITDDSIRLIHVSDGFADALADERDAEQDAEEGHARRALFRRPPRR